MTTTSRDAAPVSDLDVARAFSGHRFEETFDHPAADVRWILVGQGLIEGVAAVVRACRDSTQEMVGVQTSWLRFVTAGSSGTVAVDAVVRYEGPEGASVVSSCDVYEFDDGKVTAITSYAVDVDPADPAPPAS